MNLIGASYNLESRPASVQRTINMVPVPLEPGNERAPWVFKDVPGLVSAVSEWATEPPPAPVIATQTAQNLAFGTSWSITAPSGITAGDLLLVLVTTYAGGSLPNTTSTGWTRLDAQQNSSGSGMRSSLFAKIATGSDALSVSVSAGSSTFGSYSYWRITGTSSIANVAHEWRENGTSTATVSFDALAPDYGLVEKLWIAAIAWHGTTSITVSAFPSGYAATQQSAPVGGTNRTASASSSRSTTGSTETPGNMTLTGTSDAYQAWTIAVKG